jgi:conjugal transfer pilus assembly protein TraU
MLAVSDKGMNSWPGVAGCWGNVYPLSGYTSESASPMTGQSLLVARSLAFSVGVGLEQYTVGSKAMCEPEYNPNIIKDRFKFSVFYPRSEKGSHPIGKPSLLFGEWLNKYEGADSFVNIVFKYGECCLRK